MKKILILMALLFLAVQIYTLNAGENRRSDEVIVTTTFEAGPDIQTPGLKRL